jgi:hypothetical protein
MGRPPAKELGRRDLRRALHPFTPGDHAALGRVTPASVIPEAVLAIPSQDMALGDPAHPSTLLDRGSVATTEPLAYRRTLRACDRCALGADDGRGRHRVRRLADGTPGGELTQMTALLERLRGSAGVWIPFLVLPFGVGLIALATGLLYLARAIGPAIAAPLAAGGAPVIGAVEPRPLARQSTEFDLS